MNKPILILTTFYILTTFTFAQTGGTFDLSHNVIAGGGEKSTSGQFSLEGTIGQGVAGANATSESGFRKTNLLGTNFRLRAGFWAFEPLAPTSAFVSVGGRVYRKGGRAIPRVVVTITDTRTNYSYQTRTNPFGYYRFTNILSGETYIVTVWHKQLQFNPNTRVINVGDELQNIDFIAGK